jgi:hypothetical protein
MGAIAKRAIVLINRATEQAMYGACGTEEDVLNWLKLSKVDRSVYDVVEVNVAEYEQAFAGDIHRVKRQPDGKLHKRDKTYDELRGAEYPQLYMQLDALWHAMDSGEIPKAKKFYDDIKKIKDKYPKP